MTANSVGYRVGGVVDFSQPIAHKPHKFLTSPVIRSREDLPQPMD